jgi:hypothetical protein
MLTLSQVEAAERLLINGTPKMKVVRDLDLSRTSVEKIAAGKHLLQTDPTAFLEAYANRPVLPLPYICPHAKSLKFIQRVEVMLWEGWSQRQIALKLRVSDRVIYNIAHGFHPAQRERDGATVLWGSRAPRKPDGWAHSPQTVAAISAAIAEGTQSQNGIAREFGMRRREMRVSAYLPSPRKIGRLCAEIRRTWTPAEREERWCGPAPWTAPESVVLVA